MAKESGHATAYYFLEEAMEKLRHE